MTPIENLKKAQNSLRKMIEADIFLSPNTRSVVLSVSLRLEDIIKEIETGVDVLGRDPEEDEKVRRNCAILDEVCVDCEEDCPAAGRG